MFVSVMWITNLERNQARRGKANPLISLDIWERSEGASRGNPAVPNTYIRTPGKQKDKESCPHRQGPRT